MTRRVSIALLALLCLTGCASTARPPQLDYTPGPPVRVTDTTYTTQTFTVVYPAGWRVITPAADAPAGGIFVAPDDRALIALSVAPFDTPPTLGGLPPDAQHIEQRTVALDGVTVYVAVVALPDTLADARAAAARMTARGEESESREPLPG